MRNDDFRNICIVICNGLNNVLLRLAKYTDYRWLLTELHAMLRMVFNPTVKVIMFCATVPAWSIVKKCSTFVCLLIALSFQLFSFWR
jgi:hypothetical protein